MWMEWSRESDAVLPPPAAFTSGRMPAQALRMSARVGGLARYRPAVSRMKSISCSKGTGSGETSSIGVSVVPTRVWPCQGMANITRPSLVWGTMMAVSAAQERSVEHQVDALARRDHGRGRGVGQAAHPVAEAAGGVDDGARLDLELRARFQVAGDRAAEHPVRFLSSETAGQ